MSGTDVSQPYDCDSDAPETDMIDDDTRGWPHKKGMTHRARQASHP
jgi:hypothetical protein